MGWPEPMGLEPAAEKLLAENPDVEALSAVHGRAAEVSTAISLKRIADALHGDDENTGIIRLLGYIEDAMRAGR